jgi:hypothetical protein
MMLAIRLKFVTVLMDILKCTKGHILYAKKDDIVHCGFGDVHSYSFPSIIKMTYDTPQSLYYFCAKYAFN